MLDYHSKIAPEPRKTLLQVKNVSQNYLTGSGEQGPAVLEDVSLTLKEDEIVGLLGRSGCGKSSLLRIVSASSSRPAATSTILAIRRRSRRWRRHGVPELRPVPLALGARQCRTWPAR